MNAILLDARGNEVEPRTVTPRRVSGGSSEIRNFVTGQLKPQPIEVMARNIRPAGAIRGRVSRRVESSMRAVRQNRAQLGPDSHVRPPPRRTCLISHSVPLRESC